MIGQAFPNLFTLCAGLLLQTLFCPVLCFAQDNPEQCRLGSVKPVVSRGLISTPDIVNNEGLSVLAEGTKLEILGTQKDKSIPNISYYEVKVLTGPFSERRGYITVNSVKIEDVHDLINGQKKKQKTAYRINTQAAIRVLQTSPDLRKVNSESGPWIQVLTRLKLLSTRQDDANQTVTWYEVEVTSGDHKGSRGWLPTSSVEQYRRALVVAQPTNENERKAAQTLAFREKMNFDYYDLTSSNEQLDLSDVDRVVINLHGGRAGTADLRRTSRLRLDADWWARYLREHDFDGTEVEFVVCSVTPANEFAFPKRLSSLLQGTEVIGYGAWQRFKDNLNNADEVVVRNSNSWIPPVWLGDYLSLGQNDKDLKWKPPTKYTFLNGKPTSSIDRPAPIDRPMQK